VDGFATLVRHRGTVTTIAVPEQVAIVLDR
jgi:hypothetical protein